jgi:hypothetical protein
MSGFVQPAVTAVGSIHLPSVSDHQVAEIQAGTIITPVTRRPVNPSCEKPPAGINGRARIGSRPPAAAVQAPPCSSLSAPSPAPPVD